MSWFAITGVFTGRVRLNDNTTQTFFNQVDHVSLTQELPEVTVTFDGQKTQLVIEEVTLDHKGTFEIVAENEGGKVTSRATLFVEGKNTACVYFLIQIYNIYLILHVGGVILKVCQIVRLSNIFPVYLVLFYDFINQIKRLSIILIHVHINITLEVIGHRSSRSMIHKKGQQESTYFFQRVSS